MRAAKAAKDLQEVINVLCGTLEEAISAVPLDVDGGGTYVGSHLIPLLRHICTEVCATLPAHPTAHIAVWLLERCCAPEGLQGEARAWLTSDHPFVNPFPLEPVPPSSPPEAKKKARPAGKTRQSLEAEQTVSEPAALKKSASFRSANLQEMIGEAQAASELPLRKSASFRASDLLDMSGEEAAMGPSLSLKKSGRRSSSESQKIWKSKTVDDVGDDDDDEDSDDEVSKGEELSIGLDIFKPRAHHHNRGSVSVSDSAVIAGQRRRFTQIITTIELEMPDEQECMELLRPVKALEGLHDDAIRKVAEKAKCRVYQPDENIVPYNSVTDDLHIVVSGIASVSVPHKIGDLNRGDMFGNHLLMPTNTPCMQQIQAFGAPVTTISISSTDFEQLGLKDHYVTKCSKDRMARNFMYSDEDKATRSKMSARSLHSVPYEVVPNYEQTLSDREMIQRAVKSNKVLGDVLSLTQQQSEMMADYMRLVNFSRGNVVIEKGDRGDALYIVKEGHLDCTVDVKLEGEFRIREGDAFGELGLLYDAPRTATITAACDCRLWVLHRYEFQIVMSMNYCARAAEFAAMLSKIPYLASQIEESRMDIVAGVVEEVSLMETEEICIEGEDKGFLFLLYYGQCEATQNGQFTRFLNKGDWVGEEQLRDTIAATETVRVISESAVVIAIDRPTLRMAFDAVHAVDAKNGAPLSAPKVDDARDGAGSKGHCDQSVYNDHLTKKEVTNGLLQKRLKKALHRHRGSIQRGELEWDLRQVQFIGGLGEGSFGRVYLVQEPLSGRRAAVKVVSKEHILRENLGPMMQAERKIMMLLSSPFVVHLHASFQDANSIYLVLEPVLGGELFDIYSDHHLYGDLNIVRFHIACVTLALEHMHSLRVIYRDLKLENCLLDASGYVKLADMGIAKVAIGKSYTICGTADYFAPETLKQLGHNRAVDWWACGVLLFIMSSGRSPFDAPEVQQIYKNIIKGFSKVRFPSKFPSDLIDVIKSLCRSKPEERVTMQKGGVENLKEMPFFSKIDWPLLIEQKHEAPYKPSVPNLESIRRRKLSTDVNLDLDNVMIWDGTIQAPPPKKSSPAPEIPAMAG